MMARVFALLHALTIALVKLPYTQQNHRLSLVGLSRNNHNGVLLWLCAFVDVWIYAAK